MNRATVAMLTETWLNKGNKKISYDLGLLAQEHDIHVLRKDRTSRGGGVALAYDSRMSDFKKLPLKSLAGTSLEILAAKGKINGVKKPHLVFVCYLPPSYNAAQNAHFFDKLTDAISEARSKHPESWVTIGGDWNNRDLGPILSLFPDLAPVRSGPTRKTATLDIQMTNYVDHILSLIHI